MKNRFDMFVIFAEMRTGSNFLEANLNAVEGITCHGEAFNPHFIGYPRNEDLLGISLEERERKPQRLLRKIRKESDGLGGFRYFHDHDPRILQTVLDDPRCAKIILTRNPAESYISWKIAQSTGQWKLTNVRKRKEGQAWFDPKEFDAHLAKLQAFQVSLMKGLQTSGQTGFYIGYDDLSDVDVINGLVKWLGVDAKRDGLNTSLKRQNPEPLEDKVENFDDMQAHLARQDRFNLLRTPNFEPRRGPVVPSYVAAAKTPLLYMPIRSGPEVAVTRWMAALDNVTPEELPSGFSQKTLREWKEARPQHRSFTVLRHPLARAHAVFCDIFLQQGPGSMQGIRKTLQRAHDIPLPENGLDDSWDLKVHSDAFTAFLKFLKANLNGQTAVRVDGHWATQTQCLQGLAEFSLPDMIVREDEMDLYLPPLAMQVGHPSPPEPLRVPIRAPFSLAQIYNAEIEALAQEAYQRDYVMFGFEDWG